jgi:hypothetical protein
MNDVTAHNKALRLAALAYAEYFAFGGGYRTSEEYRARSFSNERDVRML